MKNSCKDCFWDDRRSCGSCNRIIRSEKINPYTRETISYALYAKHKKNNKGKCKYFKAKEVLKYECYVDEHKRIQKANALIHEKKVKENKSLTDKCANLNKWFTKW
jgi:hypothetical protein